MSKGLCLYSFETLYCDLTKASPTSLEVILSSVDESLDQLPAKAPLFITWDKHHELRGCIGTFHPQLLASGIKRFALTAGLNDPRFPPISANELSQLSCDVTLLNNFHKISDPLHWQIGKHGLRLNFELNGHHYSGTFLPIVAKEQQWDKLTTLWYLIRKADYNVPKSHVMEFYESGINDGTVNLETYEGLKYTMDYDEFMTWRETI